MKTLLTHSLLIIVFGAQAQLDSLRKVIALKPDNEETVLWICDTAYPYWSNKPDLMESLAKIALQRADKMDYIEGKARANHVIGVSYWARDLYDFAIEHYMKALEFYEAIDDRKGIANINLNIGSVYDDMNQMERAQLYELEALRMHRERNDTTGMSRVLNNLGVLYKRMGKMDSSLMFYKEALDIRQLQRDTVGVARIYNNLVVIQLENDDTKQGLENLYVARDLLLHKSDRYLLASIYANFGKAFRQLTEFGLAKTYLDSCLVVAKEINALSKEQLAYQFLKELALDQGQKEKAFDYLRQEVEVDQLIRSRQVAKQIEQISAQYESEKKSRLLAESEKERIRQVSLQRTTLLSLIIVLVIAAFIIYYVVTRNRRNKKKAEDKLRKMQEDLQSKNKEISSYTLNFIQKNQLMEDLKLQINELKKQSTPDTNKQLTRINRIVDETFRSDEEWENFRLTFEQMHDGFFSALKEHYPDLGNAELKLCALLRLNMNLKESARILGISPDSVKTARYRLRKKFGLKTEENLVDFLIRFEQEKLTKELTTI